MMTPEEMLRATENELKSCGVEGGYALLRYVLEKLVDWLGYEIEVEPLEEAGADSQGFCLDVLRACPTNNELIHWKGILGATVIEDKLRVSLTVFLYSGRERLFAKDGNEFVEYVYEVNDSGIGKWKLFGWYEDMYGEYEGRFERAELRRKSGEIKTEQTSFLKSSDGVPRNGNGGNNVMGNGGQ